jgi:hypothetical protein
MSARRQLTLPFTFGPKAMPHVRALGRALALLTLLIGLLATPTFADPPFNDPSGDTFGAPNTPHDIANLDALLSPSSVTFVVDFYNEIVPPSAFSATSVAGYIDVDLDQNPLTGAVAKKSEFSPAGDSRLGSEFHIDLFSERFHAGEAELVDTATVQPIGMAAVTYSATSFSVVVPLELLGGDSLFNYGLIVGDFLDVSDEAPNDGFRTTVPEPNAVALMLVGCLVVVLNRCARTRHSLANK